MLGREGDGGLGPLLRPLPFPAELRDPGRQEQGEPQAEGVRQLPGQRHGLVAPLQGLFRIAQPPQRHGDIGAACHPGVLAIAEGMGTVLLGVVEGNPLL